MECVGQSKWCGLHLSSFGSLGGVVRNRADFSFRLFGRADQRKGVRFRVRIG